MDPPGKPYFRAFHKESVLKLIDFFLIAARWRSRCQRRSAPPAAQQQRRCGGSCAPSFLSHSNQADQGWTRHEAPRSRPGRYAIWYTYLAKLRARFWTSLIFISRCVWLKWTRCSSASHVENHQKPRRTRRRLGRGRRRQPKQGSWQVLVNTNSILFCWLFKVKDWCKKVHCQQTHIQGLRQLSLMAS